MEHFVIIKAFDKFSQYKLFQNNFYKSQNNFLKTINNIVYLKELHLFQCLYNGILLAFTRSIKWCLV